jgi:cysteinyl-tRNA synthetase
MSKPSALAAVIAIAAIALALAAPLARPLLAETQPPAAPIRSWAFQLQNVDPLLIKASPYDLVVIDYGFDKDYATAFPRQVVDMMKRKPDGSRRRLFAYLSIGEAEDYRYYWRPAWKTARPEWLEPQNPDWPGNYLVQFWHPQWQSLLFGTRDAYLDRIIDAGFDGAYLDGVDKFATWRRRRPSSANDMIGLVGRLAAYARGRNTAFKIIPQNADELLTYPGYVGMIDGAAREELLYGEENRGARNPADNILDTVERLRRVTRAGKPVLIVEYTSKPEQAVSALREIRDLGFVGYIAERDLKTLSPPVVGCGQPDCSQ